MSGDAPPPSPPVEFRLDDRVVTVTGGCSLLEALRDQLGVRSVKDGCSPQGQCGCCTVLVDGAARVACVTPVERVASRQVTTVDGLERRDRWAAAFTACGASQCGFCTPGIITRLDTLPDDALRDRSRVDRALLAHLCRCTGWQSIHEACVAVAASADERTPRDLAAASQRASIEGRAPQRVGDEVALGRGGFADDTAPEGALIAVRSASGDWVVGATLAEARATAGKVQGRRTTAPPSHPVTAPTGDQWAHRLETTWLEPAYLELDATWCEPGGEPVDPLGNGGAFGGKTTTDVGEVARRLADQHGRAVRVLWSREDAVRLGPKRPPIGLGLREDGTGLVRVARPAVDRPLHLPDGLDLEWVDVAGPPVSLDLRAAVWGEVVAARAAVTSAPGTDVEVSSPDGAWASSRIEPDGSVAVTVTCGESLDDVVLRSYCIGAAHMALGMVRSESLTVDDHGEPQDLTIRSFGVLRSTDMPTVEVSIVPSDAPPVNGSDAVFAAVLAAAWRAAGFPARLPHR